MTAGQTQRQRSFFVECFDLQINRRFTAVTYQHVKRPGIIPAQAPILREPVRPSSKVLVY